MTSPQRSGPTSPRAPGPLQIEVRSTEQGPVLALVGDLDVRSTGEVRGAIYTQLHDQHDVVLDLSGVRAVDLVALRLLAVATRQAARAGHHLVLRGCSPSVRRMLHLSRLRRSVEVEDPAVRI